MMLTNDKNLVVDALFLHPTTTPKKLLNSVRFCDIDFLGWLLKHKIIVVSLKKCVDKLTAEQLGYLVRCWPRYHGYEHVLYCMHHDSPAKVEIILNTIRAGSMYTGSCHHLLGHMLTAPLPKSKKLFMAWVSKMQPQVNPVLDQTDKERILHKILKSRYNIAIKKQLLAAEELTLLPTNKVISMVAMHGSGWLSYISLTSPLTQEIMEGAVTANICNRGNRGNRNLNNHRNRRRALGCSHYGNHCSGMNINLKNVAKLADIQLPPKLIKSLDRTVLRRCTKANLCTSTFASGIRQGDHCLRSIPCNLHRK